MRPHSICVVAALALVTGCERSPMNPVIDAAMTDTALIDAAVVDAAMIDATVIDAAVDPACLWAAVSAGSQHTCGRKNDGTILCWGLVNTTQMTALGMPAAFSAGAHTCGQKTDGTLWCWGSNNYGQLGDGTTSMSYVPPVQVTAMGGDTVEVSAGGWGIQWWERAHTCGRKADGTLWCWGSNFYGQLGAGTTTDELTPVQVTAVGGDTVEVSAGGMHTCGRKSDGTLWCWGYNIGGQLGDGTTAAKSAPVQVAAFASGAVEISSGGVHTCGRKSDGTLWCWGSNSSGAIGDGTTTGRLTPRQVTALGSAVAEVAAGYAHTCARKTDGTVWCWGHNGTGQLGDGGNVDRITPGQVIGLGNATAEVSAGDGHTCARKTDGTLWCWGYNSYGQVGAATMPNTFLPQQVCK